MPFKPTVPLCAVETLHIKRDEVNTQDIYGCALYGSEKLFSYEILTHHEAFLSLLPAADCVVSWFWLGEFPMTCMKWSREYQSEQKQVATP